MTYDADSDRYKTRRELSRSTMNPTLEAALKYAANGLAVFPVKGKIPATAHGFKDATTDETQIRLWWDLGDGVEVPGIAIATGNEYGLAVLDIDPRNGGDVSLDELAREGLVLPETVTVMTGGGGKHFYFAIPKGVEFRGRSAIRPGIDVKADGGYVVAPPSPHQSGRAYVFEASAELGDVAIAPMPAQLLALVQVQPQEKKTAPASKPLADSYPEGTRHQFLLAALGAMRRKNFSRESALAAIREENRIKCKPPYTDVELVELVGDVFARWKAAEDVKLKAKSTGLPPDDGLTDLGNAKRFVEKFKSEFVYSHTESKWYQWTTRNWARDAICAAQRAAATIAADLRDDAEKLVEESKKARTENRNEEADSLSRKATDMAVWAKKSESAARIASILSLAAPMLQVDVGIFDQKPLLFNFANGTVDMVTGTLLPHNPSDYITCIADYDYDENAEAPTFRAFMMSIMAQRAGLANFLLSLMGYSATGLVKEQILICCYGPTGANGKSVLFDIMAHVFGDYWCKAPSGMLEESQSERHPTVMASMVGKRLVTSIETGMAKKMDENIVKELTGGDKRSCRRMYEDFWSYSPTDKMWIGSNHRLRISLDPALMRRLIEIPFDVHYHDPEKGETGPDHLRVDKGLLDKLKAERAGIARLIMWAAKDYLENGLKIPGEVLEAVADYKADMDAIGEWIVERVVAIPQVTTTFSDLYRDFIGWCEKTKSPRLSSTAFSIQMQQKGHVRIRDAKGRRAFHGLGLKHEAYPMGDAPEDTGPEPKGRAEDGYV